MTTADDLAVVYDRRAGAARLNVHRDLIEVRAHIADCATGRLLGLREDACKVNAVACHRDDLALGRRSGRDGAELPVSLIGRLAQVVRACVEHRPVVACGIFGRNQRRWELVRDRRVDNVTGSRRVGHVELHHHTGARAVTGRNHATVGVVQRGGAGPRGRKQPPGPQLTRRDAVVAATEAFAGPATQGQRRASLQRHLRDHNSVVCAPRRRHQFDRYRVAVEVSRAVGPHLHRGRVQLLHLAIELRADAHEAADVQLDSVKVDADPDGFRQVDLLSEGDRRGSAAVADDAAVAQVGAHVPHGPIKCLGWLCSSRTCNDDRNRGRDVGGSHGTSPDD